jgi:hypothetical protein
MEKKIIEWFKELEEPYKSQAISNTGSRLLREKKESLKEALLSAFLWDRSPQGQEYWSKLEEDLKNKPNVKGN